MVKVVSLVSLTAGGYTEVTLTRLSAEAGPLTVQANDPLFGALGLSVDHVPPPSLLISIFTFNTASEDVQVISLFSPTVHASPPFGEVTEI